jgi:uncharacterized protein (UPF0264 family)
MQLLVSVRSATEANAALAGGAEIIDAKDPAAGPLGAVTHDVLRRIHRHVNGRAPVSAALGDAVVEQVVEQHARTCAAIGAWFVKIGFAGTKSLARVGSLIGAAVQGAAISTDHVGGVVAVAYGDSARAESLRPFDVLDAAVRHGAHGVLLDTAEKDGPGIRRLMTEQQISAWVQAARDRGLRVAVAGKLTAGDFPFVRETGADIVGVRGAACNGGRTGRVVASKVRLLAAQR